MGTRHMIGIIKNNEWKVGQYGQWDGYPDGQGFVVLSHLRNGGVEKLRKNVDKCRFVTAERIRQYYVDAGDDPNNKSGFISCEVSDRMHEAHPTLSRDMGADVLGFIIDYDGNEIELFDQHDFIEDETFCEFAYVVNFDSNKLVCYAGSVNDIFAEYDLDNLPENKTMLEDYHKWVEENKK